MNTAATTPSTDLATALTAADTLRNLANAEVFGHPHAFERPGRVYGDATSILHTALSHAFGPDATDVYDVMLDSGEGWEYAARYVAARRYEEALDAATVSLTCSECSHGLYWSTGWSEAACECGHSITYADLDLDDGEVLRVVNGVLGYVPVGEVDTPYAPAA